jgi:Protein of unknown function DUF262
MDEFHISPLRNSSVAYLHQQRKLIQLEPPYQRQGGIWTIEKQQLLIDSIINGFDVPKIYFHEFPTRRIIDGKTFKYAIIDGKQRLQAIWEFLDNKYALQSDFEYFEDPSVRAGGMNFDQLSRAHPDIAALFNATTLNVIAIRTADVEVIEEMFSRLNEAVPLNAAEKRNAIGGPVPAAVRALVGHEFFKDKLPFNNSRYRHYDLAAKFLLWAHEGKVVDVKKIRLDNFAKSMKRDAAGAAEVGAAQIKAERTLDWLAGVFADSDQLLAQVGMVSVLFLLRLLEGRKFSRTDLVRFNEARHTNRAAAENDLSEAQYELLEFDRFGQSPNDGSALSYRVATLEKFLDGDLG